MLERAAKMLNPSTDLEELSRRAFVQLDGVSDEWIKGLTVEKVAGGQISDPDNEAMAAMAKDGRSPCCIEAK